MSVKGIVNEALKQIHEGTELEISQLLFNLTYSSLLEAVNKGLEGEIKQEFKSKLKYSAASFSAHKTAAQCAELRDSLLDENGKKRSFAKFKKAVSGIVDNYNVRWLEVEHQAAVRGARMATNWQRWEAQADIYPNLRYLQTRATTPDEAHLKLVGIVRPMNDPFWRKHLPPSRWGCLCGAVPTTEGVTELPEKLPEVSQGLGGNVGQTGELFTDDHPYFSKKVSEQTINSLQDAYKPSAE
ncbi:Phage Mu protein F like protein [Pseudarcicella hirudinis]|uniref:Phage Mu protein F like protein n=2 Tax=Pseudarcicella hirudinis TaxID=1079859 RepID=A0A1I5MWY6_9BACT|nr:hypothetical protein [Pseudarcicella hirudinis]SFP14040.1 Phage Mu protein F like protein [Pseudarcicella hirudinis]